MLRRFIEWVDSLSENANPLVVRDVRRMFRNPLTFWFLCLYSVLIILIVAINWNVIIITSWDGNQLFDGKQFLADASLVLACILCYWGGSCGWMGIMDMAAMFVRDETFLMNTLSPRQYLHAYMTISIIKLLFVISLSLLPLTVAQLIGVRRLNLHFLYIIPILSFLAGQTLSLLWLSTIMAHGVSHGIKRFPTRREEVVDFFLINLLQIMFWSLLAPWLLVLYLWKDIFELPPPSFYNRFDLISIYFLLPMMLVTKSVTAYRLCCNGFKINYKPKYSGIFYNIFIYTILNICFAVIYFILVLLFR
jgi:hypothetical protein